MSLIGLAACASQASTPPPQPAAAPAAAPAAPPAPSGQAPAGGGLYTNAQADRGQQVFNTVCAACHSMNEFRGRLFVMAWGSRSVNAFFQFISTSMPQDAPGSLSPEQYAAVTAYVLRLNNQPAGNTELPTNSQQLEAMRWSD